jgi:hypothetical protein
VGIEEFYVTFGVQYSTDSRYGELHPLGMHKDGYAVIEAPDMATAQRIADAVFGQKYAFIYDRAHFIDDGTFDRWYADQEGPLLTLKWVQQ